MDLSDALFSPSKARQQQAQAKDWIFVDSWLSKKYHPKPVPSFERNEETLQALMTLVAFNERADEEQALVEKVERQALNELEEKVGLVLSCLYCLRIRGTSVEKERSISNFRSVIHVSLQFLRCTLKPQNQILPS